MNKALLIPIAAFVALISKEVFNIDFNGSEIDIIINGILAIATSVGFFMHPKTKKKNRDA